MVVSKVYFEEKILYKTRQHWIIPIVKSSHYILFILPILFLIYFLSTSWILIFYLFFSTSTLVISYKYYIWFHSWFFVGNQNITLSIRNGIFSQYAMNVRYSNIRDVVVSKHTICEFLFKYGTITIRSSPNEWDFHVNFIPKVGKIYALINALSHYSDEERYKIDSIETLHTFHQKKEFPNIYFK